MAGWRWWLKRRRRRRRRRESRVVVSKVTGGTLLLPYTTLCMVLYAQSVRLVYMVWFMRRWGGGVRRRRCVDEVVWWLVIPWRWRLSWSWLLHLMPSGWTRAPLLLPPRGPHMKGLGLDTI